jgi:hypothetical protein
METLCRLFPAGQSMERREKSRRQRQKDPKYTGGFMSEKARERIRELLKIRVSMMDIIRLIYLEFKLEYDEIKRLLYIEVHDAEKTNME